MSAWWHAAFSLWGGRLLRRLVRDLTLPAPAVATPVGLLAGAILLGIVFAGFNQLGVPLRASHSARVTADEPFYLLTTVSLIEDGDLDLANDYQLRRYRAYFDHPQDLWYQSDPTADGRVLSPHNPGLSLLILPAYALGGLDGVKRFLGALGGGAVAFSALLAYRATVHMYASLAAAALLGVSAPLLIYATQVYPESPGALLVVISVWLLLGRQPGWLSAVLLVLGLDGLLWLGAKYGLVGGALALFGLIRLRSHGRILFGALLTVSLAGYAWFHLATYGGLTPYAVNRLYSGSSTIQLIGLHLESWSRLYRLVGLWLDREFGLIRWAPILLLTIPAATLLARRAGPVRWILPLVFGAPLLAAIFLSITMRGWWFPGRMLIVVLPLLAIPLAETIALARDRLWLAGVAGVLGLYSLGVSLALREAVAAERIALAVDPFELAWLPFQALAVLFPLYTAYEAPTWLLTAAWLLAALLAGGWGARAGARPPPGESS